MSSGSISSENPLFSIPNCWQYFSIRSKDSLYISRCCLPGESAFGHRKPECHPDQYLLKILFFLSLIAGNIFLFDLKTVSISLDAVYRVNLPLDTGNPNVIRINIF